MDQWSSKKYAMFLISIVCLGALITSVIIVVFMPKPEPNVSGDIVDKYAQTLVSDYDKNINFFLPSNYSYFPFHSNLAYNATTVISSNYGTALLLYPSDTWSFNNTETAQRVEEAVFGANNFNSLTQLDFNGNGIAIEGLGGYAENNHALWQDIGFAVSPNSSIMFRNVNVNSVPYFFLIIKTNNRASSWSSNVALNDSRLIFDDDLYYALNNSEAIREYYAYPQLATLLINDLTKWHDQLLANSSIVYSPAQFEYDVQEIEELAKTKYGITNNDFINDTLNYLEGVTLPPPPPTKTIFGFQVNDPDNWIYVTVWCTLLIFAYALYLPFEHLRRKSPSGNMKYSEVILTAVIIPIALFLASNHPYDYHFLSIQTATVFAVLLIGFVGVYHERKRLLTH